MELRNLRNKEDVVINGKRYFISSIPATAATKIVFRAFGSLSSGNIADLPNDLFLELLSYAGGYNDNKKEIQFADEEIIDEFVEDPMDLIDLAAHVVEKNFGFFGDGRLKSVATRLSRILSPAVNQDTPNA